MKKLVAYFSVNGTTAGRAAQLARAADADIFEIVPAVPYTQADIDYSNSKSRSSAEMNDEAARPAMAGPAPDLAAYDAVYIGFPIWWYTAPRIINTFIESGDFSGKKIAGVASAGRRVGDGGRSRRGPRHSKMKIVGGKLLNGGVSGDIM